MRMKKIRRAAAALLIMIGLAVLLPARALAYSDSSEEDIAQTIDSELRGIADGEAADYLEENGITVSDPESVSHITPDGAASSLWEKLKTELSFSKALLGRILAAVLLCAVIGSFADDGRSGFIVNTTAVLAISASAYESLKVCLTLCKTTLDSLTAFMAAYIPLCTSVSAASGNAGSGASFYTSAVFVCEVIALVTSRLLFPAVSVLTALVIVGAVDDTMELSSCAATVKQTVNLALSALMCLFTGYMAVSGAAASSADSLRAKGVRFAASSFIPVIGGAVSESLGTVQASLSVIRTSVGAVGIILIAATVLPPLISIIAVRLTLTAGKLVCDAFGQQRPSKLIEGLGSVLSIMMSLLVCFAMMFVIATGSMLAFTVRS